MADSEGLSSDLTLDISSALRQIDALESALAAITTDVPLTVDTGNVADAISSAVAAADATTTVDADAAPVTASIDEAVAASDNTTTIEGDASSVTGAIDEAVAASDQTIDVTADTSSAEASLSGLASTADTASSSLSGTGSAATGAGAGLSTFEAAALGAEGSAAGLTGVLKDLDGSGAAAAGTLGALGVVTAGLFGGAVALQGAEERLSSTFGTLSGRIQTINVGSLNEDLHTLAQSLGTTDAAIDQSAATLQQYGISAGASADQSERTTEQFIALAARAVALNPALGSVSDVADTMATRLARGGRFAQALNISLTAAEINARALADTGKTAATDLTVYEKAAAAAALATEKYGDDLKAVIEEGTANPILRLRALSAEFKNAAETIGQPLISPVFDLLQSVLPVATKLATGFADATEGLLPILNALLSVLNLIPGPLLSTAVAFGVLFAALRALAGISVVESIITRIATALTASTVAEEAAVAETLALASAQAEGAAATAAYAAAQVAAAEATAVAVEEETAATDAAIAMNPVLLAIAAAVAIVTTVLHANSAEHARFKQAVAASTSGLSDFSKSVDDNLTSVEQAADKTGDLAKSLDEGGLSFAGLNAAQRAGTEATKAYEAETLDAAKAAGLSDGAILDLIITLDRQTKANQKGAEATIENAVASGLLTKAQAASAEAAHKNSDGTVNYLAALDALTPRLRSATAAQDAQTRKDQEAAQQAETLITQTETYAAALTDVAVKHGDVAFALAGVKAEADPSAAALTALASTTDKAGLSAEQMSALAADLGINVQSLGPILSEITKETQGFVDAIVSKLPSVDDAVSSLGKSVDPSKFVKALHDQEDNVNGFVLRIQALIDQGDTALAKTLADQGPQIGGALAKSFLDAGPDTAAAANAQVTSTQTALDNAKAAAERWGPGFESTLGTAAATASKNWHDNIDLQTGVDDATAIAVDAALRGGASAGEALDQGLASGMARQAALVRAAAAQVAFFAVSELNKKFGISSPSTVTAAIGDQVSRGLALGIERTADEPVTAAQAAAQATAAALAASVNDAVGTGVAAAAAFVGAVPSGGPGGQTLVINNLTLDLSGARSRDEARDMAGGAVDGLTEAARRAGFRVEVRSL